MTIVMAVYGQPLMLARQVETIASYDDEVLDKLTVVIVDDHGTPPVTEESVAQLRGLCTVKVFRALVDTPWNQMCARNVGMREAPEGVCVLLDPDMLIEREMSRSFLTRALRLRRGHVVKFGLRHSDGRVDFTSPNTWMIHRADFFAAGGYDEDFRGHKGWSDCLLQETLRAFYPIEVNQDLLVAFHLPSDGIEDAQVAVSAGVDRDISYNKELKRRKNQFIDKMGGFKRYISRGLKGAEFTCKVERII